MSTEGTLSNADQASTVPRLDTAGATSESMTDQENETAATDGQLTHPPTQAKPDETFYFCKETMSGTWVHAQARLYVAKLSPREEEESAEEEEDGSSKEKDEASSQDEEEEEDDEDDDDDDDDDNLSTEEAEKSEEEDSVGSYESNAGEIESDYEEDPEFSPKGRTILNPEVVIQSAQLFYDVINNHSHKDADTVLSTDRPSVKGGIRNKSLPWATVGKRDPTASPRDLAKSFYQHVMEFTPKSDNGDPILDGMSCQSYSTNKEHRNKKCKCIKNTHLMMVNDLRILHQKRAFGCAS